MAKKNKNKKSGFSDHHPRNLVPVGELRIPRFKISSEFKACEVAKGLGLVLPFSDNEADLTKGQNLYVSNMFHKSVVEVNEEGTEAAAAAAILVGGGMYVSNNKINFVADHPFLFMIREDVTEVVLFIGHMLNPLES